MAQISDVFDVQMENWAVERLLDIDFYKFTMGQLVQRKYPDVPVRYSLRCRTKEVALAEEMDEGDLRKELDHAMSLGFSTSELHYLRGTNEYAERMFSENYLAFLSNLHLPPYTLERSGDGQFMLEFPGKWPEAIYWETIALSIVNELFYRSRMKKLSRFQRDAVYATGISRLQEKITQLKSYPSLTFTEFGTRRRFSRHWQRYVTEVLGNETGKQMKGTSNTQLAMELGMLPCGTSAHELFMTMACIAGDSDEEIRASHNKVLRDWWEQYGWGLSIALTDTFGTDFFFRDMTKDQARNWKGLRQDSGDTIGFGEKAIRFYENHGIDPKSKIVIFSDGLDVREMLRIFEAFHGRIETTFGWGTNATNDLGFKPLSLVVKVKEANGRGAVKLSDNIAKAIGRPEDVARYKRIFGYEGVEETECKY